MEQVVLVDREDNAIGVMEKMEAHRRGLLHRAFSVFLFNADQELLLQQRAKSKYHSGGLWTNTCCSHPRPHENTLEAAKRRLQEEMGITCDLQFKKTFIYKSEFENGLTEHELDHVFTGVTSKQPVINKEEVESFRWLELAELKKLIKKEPDSFTTWFRIAISEIF